MRRYDEVDPDEIRGRKLVVYHSYYGCDTGCCGHTLAFADNEDDIVFDFDHPHGEDPLEFAKEMIRDTFGEEHVTDLDWENCVVVDS